MEALTEQLQALMAVENQQNQPQYNLGHEGLEGDDYQEVPRPRRRPHVRFEEEMRQDDWRIWESGMHTEVPEFQGSLQPEEFIDQLCNTEEVMKFKWVPKEMKVLLIATRLRGRVAAWWQQFKITRSRLGKSKVTTWEKMKKHLYATFLLYNYQRIMYQWLQKLRQRALCVEDYTKEFY